MRHHTQRHPRTPTTTAPSQPVKAVRSRIHLPHRRSVPLPPARGVPAADMPRHGLTPGAVLTTSAATVCVSGYSSRVRDVPDSEKELAYARYGIAHVPYAHEVDHLISLELGGSNVITNLWPEPYAGRWGARTKDTLENKLHDLVCVGAMKLRHAQRIEGANWVAAYKMYVGTPQRPARPTSRPATTSRTQAATGSCEPGYSPCLPVVTDLDCGDLSSAQTPVRVTGDDPYRLDADGDGYGCES
jgi:hypothetical protein